MKKWSRSYTKCVRCGSTESRHVTRGLCNRCYQRDYKSDLVINARINAQKEDWYYRHHKENLMKRRIAREQRWFSGVRDLVLKRDKCRCTTCGTPHQLVVHHKDGNGRGKKQPNNSLDNLTTLCRSCHIEIHRRELLAARSQRKI